jgi:hypothetical protein
MAVTMKLLLLLSLGDFLSGEKLVGLGVSFSICTIEALDF